MTSNAGSTDTGNSPVGFAQADTQNRLMQRLANYFRPEFLNRFDDIVEFQPLSQDDLLKIVDLLLHNMNDNLSENGLHIEVSDSAKKQLVSLGYDPSMGARPLRRVLQDKIADGIADYYLAHPNVHQLYADWQDQDFTINEVQNEPAQIEK
jgi:ATP-dependent Clp protease ATP-binding subunit ClpE